ncbi:hypothetical protein DL770_004180 [Monosporascus sp. CRB-9-2]|nr:hypothetical protein DL770_004180 [Monosporascus sp. CRB-9-2]
MEVIAALMAWSMSAACCNVPASSWLGAICHRGAKAEELSERLSSKAQVYFPGSDGFAPATARWSALSTPEVNVVIVPGVENDVAATLSSVDIAEDGTMAKIGGGTLSKALTDALWAQANRHASPVF